MPEDSIFDDLFEVTPGVDLFDIGGGENLFDEGETPPIPIRGCVHVADRAKYTVTVNDRAC